MFWEMFKSVYLFVNITNFELYSVSFICGFDIVNWGKTHRENPFLSPARAQSRWSVAMQITPASTAWSRDA